MKRRLGLSIAAASLGVLTIAGTAFGANPFACKHNPYSYGDEMYGSQHNAQTAIPEPGKKNNNTWEWYYHADTADQPLP